jgi:HK97 family phage prohead protease
MDAMHRVPDVDLVRSVTAVPELRAVAVDGSLGTLVLRFSVFDCWYPVSSLWEGDFVERTKRGSFKQTIREDRAGMRSLFDHGFDMMTGDKPLGPIDDLREEPDSPVGEVPLFDTNYNRELLPGLKAGVYGSSFRFRVQEESWNDEPDPSDDNPKGLPERTITRIKLFEFGPVTWPANPDATAEMNSAAVRSATDQFYDRLAQRDTSAFEAAVRCVRRSVPDFTGRPGGEPGGGAHHNDDKPGNGKPSTDLFDDPESRDLYLRSMRKARL